MTLIFPNFKNTINHYIILYIILIIKIFKGNNFQQTIFLITNIF